MEKAEHEGSDTMLAVVVWPEPYGYDATSEEQKTRIEYTFDADGIAKGVDWLNEQFASQAERWKKSRKQAISLLKSLLMKKEKLLLRLLSLLTENIKN